MTENRESPLSAEVPILEGQVLTGPLFSEPMRVETVRSDGPGVWVAGLVGQRSGFRDPQKTLYNFDFSFNQKMNRSLVFDLVLLGGVWIHLPPTSGTPSRLEPEPWVQPTGVNSQPAAWAERPAAAAEDNPC